MRKAIAHHDFIMAACVYPIVEVIVLHVCSSHYKHYILSGGSRGGGGGGSKGSGTPLSPRPSYLVPFQRACRLRNVCRAGLSSRGLTFLRARHKT